MKSSRCSGRQTQGIIIAILHEIDRMILNFEILSPEHYQVVNFFRYRLRGKLQ